MAVGLLLALLYLRTDNLFIVIGAHALIDAPTPLFASTFIGAYGLVLVFVVLAVLAWPLFTQKQGKRTQLRMSSSS